MRACLRVAAPASSRRTSQVQLPVELHGGDYYCCYHDYHLAGHALCTVHCALRTAERCEAHPVSHVNTAQHRTRRLLSSCCQITLCLPAYLTYLTYCTSLTLDDLLLIPSHRAIDPLVAPSGPCCRTTTPQTLPATVSIALQARGQDPRSSPIAATT